MPKRTTDWQTQWHIGADGTVIRQRSKGDEPHQQIYHRYHPASPNMRLADLEELDDRIARFFTFWVRASKVLWYGSWPLFAVFLAGLVALWFDIGDGIWLPMLLISGPLLVALAIGIGAISPHLLRGSARLYVDAGFESASYETMAAGEARAMIDDPRTVSGRTTPEFRA